MAFNIDESKEQEQHWAWASEKERYSVLGQCDACGADVLLSQYERCPALLLVGRNVK